MTVPSPILAPGQMMAPPPTQTSQPIEIGLAASSRRRRTPVVQRMRRRVDLHGGPEQDIAADPHVGGIEHAIEVEEDAIAQSNLLAVVAVERRFYANRFADRAEQFRIKGMSRGFVGGRRIDSMQQLPSLLARQDELGVGGIIKFAAEHLDSGRAVPDITRP